MKNEIQVLTSSSSFTLGNESADSHCSRSIKTFNHEQFGQIRICQNEGKEWFCLSDVCKALSLAIPARVKERLSERGIHSMNTPTYNQHGTMVMQKMTYIDEANLYRCIFQSRKQEAEQFQNWVFEVVLPQIRKTGGFIPVSREDDEKTILCKAVKILMKTVEVQKQELAEQDIEIARLAPKAEYAEEVLMSPTCYTMTQVAKSLSMTVHELQQWLHQKRIIYRSPSGPWMLYAPYLKKGYEAYRTKKGENLFGEVLWTDTYLVWTERGKEFIHSIHNA